VGIFGDESGSIISFGNVNVGIVDATEKI